MRRIIDCHTHFFNAAHWPLRGILRANLGRLPALLLEGLVQSIRFNTEEDPQLDVRVTELGADLLASPFVDSGFEFAARGSSAPPAGLPAARLGQAEVVHDLVAHLSDDLVLADDAETERFLHEYSDEDTIALATESAAEFIAVGGSVSAAGLRDVASLRRGAIESALRNYIIEAASDLKDHQKHLLLHLFEFLRQAQRSEIQLVNEYMGMVSNPVLLVHHMMDLEVPYFEGSMPFDFKRQIRRLRKLSSLYPGKLLGFVAYDPYRGDLEEVTDAVKGGFCGVKIYPPTGYRIIGNGDSIRDVSGIIADISDGKLNGVKMDERLLAFYRMCVHPDRDVPIMCHCNNSGFERGPRMRIPNYDGVGHEKGTGNLCDPRSLFQLMENREFANLRLCFAHAGGHTWFDETRENGKLTWVEPGVDWREVKDFCHSVYLACRRFPNVYCDFGHLVEAMDLPHGEALRNRLIDLIDRESRPYGDFKFFDKVVFGSDYYMPNEHGDYGEYARQFAAIFGKAPLAQHADAFFVNNAKRFLNLPGFLRRCGPSLTSREKAAFTQLAV
jgi:predicted TIM-barrel fold metal-dependent hydrolase